MDHVECIVIGAGVVGLAIAAELAQRGREVLVLEQHDLIGSETSSRNSEVIHAGIYYPQGSLKAELCVQGKALLYEFCERFQVPHRRCGKLIVAADDSQTGTVQAYIEKARANGVADLEWLSAAAVAELEPEVRSVGAVFSPSTGIIDSHAYMLALQGVLEAHGGMVALNTPVQALQTAPLGVQTDTMQLQCDMLINAAGLHAPALAAAAWPPQLGPAPQAYYAKGHYYAYSGQQPFQRLVYPVAEPGGLGVHVTLDLAGQVKFGPDVRWQSDLDYSFDERHFSDFLQAIERYYPQVDPERLHPSYTGIRPKIAPPDGGFQDFRILSEADHGLAGCVHLLGIESPGLTASLAIAARVADVL